MNTFPKHHFKSRLLPGLFLPSKTGNHGQSGYCSQLGQLQGHEELLCSQISGTFFVKLWILIPIIKVVDIFVQKGGMYVVSPRMNTSVETSHSWSVQGCSHKNKTTKQPWLATPRSRFHILSQYLRLTSRRMPRKVYKIRSEFPYNYTIWTRRFDVYLILGAIQM